MSAQPSSLQYLLNREVSYLKLVEIVLSRWYWLIAALIIGLAASFLYLSYTSPQYVTSASLKFEDKRSEIAELINIRNVYERTNKVESEKQVICSKNVISKAIKSLNYTVSYEIEKGFRKLETYPWKPFSIQIIWQDKIKHTAYRFIFETSGKYEFQLSCNSENRTTTRKKYRYGQVITVPGLAFRIQPLGSLSRRKRIYFNFIDETSLLEKVSKALKVDDAQNISILTLKFTDQNPQFATNLLNAILNEYLIFDKMQRSVSMSQTSSFISEVLKSMSDSVDRSGMAIQKFKEKNHLLDISENSNQALLRIANLEKEKYILDIKNELLEMVLRNLNTSTDKLNFNLQGITDPQLHELLLAYNELIIKKKNQLNTYAAGSTIILQTQNMILDFRQAILKNLNTQQEAVRRSKHYLSLQMDSINQGMASIPGKERSIAGLQSKFDVDQKVYSYLAEKRLEAQISNAAVVPGAIVIDRATYPEQPVAPIPRNIYTLFIMSALALGCLLIFAIRLLNPYIYNKETITQLTEIPVIGIVNSYSGNKELNHEIISLQYPRSLFTESVRSIRGNLNFLAPEEGSKVICLSSEISGEGKSFLSLNLASSLTLIEKRVIIIAADLRKSSLHKELNIDNQNGLSKYLSGQVQLTDICHSTSIPLLDFIPSGPLPPNPSELLCKPKMKQLLELLKENYDFIILDSAPIGLVSDTKPLIKLADINLFILRSGVSRHQFATTPERLKKEFDLSNILIVLNDFKGDKFYSPYYKNDYLSKHHDGYYHSHSGSKQYHED